jgi:hypothetical protein
MKFELKSIDYWSLLRTSFVVNLVLGFIIGIFFALFMGLFMSMISNLGGLSGISGMPEELPGFGFLIIIYPIFFAFIGAVFNTVLYLIIAFVYNIIARMVGGVIFEFNQVPVAVMPVQSPPTSSYYAPSYNQPTPPPPPPPPVQPMPPDIKPPEENDMSGNEPK